MKKRKFLKHTKQEMSEIDYLNRLSPEDRDWMVQFLLEYYQADFNFPEVIHPEKYKKDCRERNNKIKVQIHSVGSDIVNSSAKRVVDILNGTNNSLKHRYYLYQDCQPKWIYDPSEEASDVE